MSTWLGVGLSATMGTIQGVTNVTLNAATGGNKSSSEAYGAGHQTWQSVGDAVQNTAVNYDSVNASQLSDGDVYVMWARTHTYLVLERPDGYFIYEQCGSGFNGGGGPQFCRKSNFKELRDRYGCTNYIVHHQRASLTKPQVDAAADRIKGRFQGKYNLGGNNCHHYCDALLVQLGFSAVGGGYYKTAASQCRD